MKKKIPEYNNIITTSTNEIKFGVNKNLNEEKIFKKPPLKRKNYTNSINNSNNIFKNQSLATTMKKDDYSVLIFFSVLTGGIIFFRMIK